MPPYPKTISQRQTFDPPFGTMMTRSGYPPNLPQGGPVTPKTLQCAKTQSRSRTPTYGREETQHQKTHPFQNPARSSSRRAEKTQHPPPLHQKSQLPRELTKVERPRTLRYYTQNTSHPYTGLSFYRRLGKHRLWEAMVSRRSNKEKHALVSKRATGAKKTKHTLVSK